MSALLAGIILLANALGNEAASMLSEDASAAEIIAACRSLVPSKAELEGKIVYAHRKSVATGKRAVDRDYRYTLRREGKTTELKVGPVDGELTTIEAPKTGDFSIEGTGVNYSDLALDYLWWDDISFDPEQKTETLTILKCARLLLKKGDRTIRLWVTYRHGAPEQAEELKDGKVIRKLWASRIKSFGERWMASRLEVQDMTTQRRTRITVDALK